MRQKQTILLLTAFAATVLLFSCSKDTVNSLNSQLDTLFLTKYNWLKTPKPDTFVYCYFRGAFYKDTLITIDSTRYSFNLGSSYKEDYITIQSINPGTTPVANCTPSGSPLPVVSHSIYGTYKINIADSIIEKIQYNQPDSIPPLTQKILLLTKDSLKLFQDTIPRYHLAPITYYFYSVPK
jgi:hypothetical protein